MPKDRTMDEGCRVNGHRFRGLARQSARYAVLPSELATAVYVRRLPSRLASLRAPPRIRSRRPASPSQHVTFPGGHGEHATYACHAQSYPGLAGRPPPGGAPFQHPGSSTAVNRTRVWAFLQKQTRGVRKCVPHEVIVTDGALGQYSKRGTHSVRAEPTHGPPPFP